MRDAGYLRSERFEGELVERLVGVEAPVGIKALLNDGVIVGQRVRGPETGSRILGEDVEIS